MRAIELPIPVFATYHHLVTPRQPTTQSSATLALITNQRPHHCWLSTLAVDIDLCIWLLTLVDRRILLLTAVFHRWPSLVFCWPTFTDHPGHDFFFPEKSTFPLCFSHRFWFWSPLAHLKIPSHIYRRIIHYLWVPAMRDLPICSRAVTRWCQCFSGHLCNHPWP